MLLTISPHPPNSHSSVCLPDRIVVSDFLNVLFSFLFLFSFLPDRDEVEHVELDDRCEEFVLEEQKV